MTKYERIPAKVFAENASPVGENPEIGKFGNALQGIYTGEADVQEIQNSEAWSQGWTSAVISAMNYPPLPEMNGVLKVLSYQIAYLLQSGIAEWNSETTYYEYNAVNYKGKFYYSTINNNTTEPETLEGSANWELIQTPTATSNSKGVVQPDNSTITIDDNGILSAVTATATQKGISQPDNNTISINEGNISVSDSLITTINSKVTLAQATESSFPSVSFTRLDIGATGTQYTAPYNGYMNLHCLITSAGYVKLYDRSGHFNAEQRVYANNVYINVWLPVRKGHIVALSYNAVITSDTASKNLWFIWALGDR